MLNVYFVFIFVADIYKKNMNIKGSVIFLLFLLVVASP